MQDPHCTDLGSEAYSPPGAAADPVHRFLDRSAYAGLAPFQDDNWPRGVDSAIIKRRLTYVVFGAVLEVDVVVATDEAWADSAERAEGGWAAESQDGLVFAHRAMA